MLALPLLELLALLLCTADAVPMRKLDQLSRSAPDVLVRMNPLKELAPLQKLHHSWGLPNYYLNSSATFIDGVMYDYVRITGSCSIALVDATPSAVQSCVTICKAVAAARKAAGVAPPSIAVNWSPWYEYFPGNDPTVTGAAEAKEMAFYKENLKELQEWLGPENQKLVTAFLIDEEKWDAGVGPVATVNAANRKADLVYNATMAAFPGVRYEMYNRGAVTASDRYNHWTLDRQNANITDIWSRVYRYSLAERGNSFTISLYVLPEIWNMRGIMQHTVALAKQHNSSGQTLSVNPWIGLGCGYHRTANRTGANADLPGNTYDLKWDFDRVTSWSFGAEINQPWCKSLGHHAALLRSVGAHASRSEYRTCFCPRDADGAEGRENMFAPWRYAQVVMFYPSVFDLRSVPAGPDEKSTVMLQHFASYVRGASGVAGVAP